MPTAPPIDPFFDASLGAGGPDAAGTLSAEDAALVKSLKNAPHDSLCAARWPDSSTPCYCDKSVKGKAAARIEELSTDARSYHLAYRMDCDRISKAALVRAEQAEARAEAAERALLEIANIAPFGLSLADAQAMARAALGPPPTESKK